VLWNLDATFFLTGTFLFWRRRPGGQFEEGKIAVRVLTYP